MLKKINFILIIGMLLGMVYYVLFKNDGSSLVVIPILMLPFLIRKTRFRFNDKNLFYYYVFMFLGYFLGNVVDLYDIVWWYDIFIHFISGIFIFGSGLFLLKRIKLRNSSFLFYSFFCICLVMFGASIWELFEFAIDCLFDTDLQSSLDTGVRDTMIDMLMALIGGILSGISYLVRKQ